MCYNQELRLSWSQFEALHISECPGDFWGLETKHKLKGNFRICFILIFFLYWFKFFYAAYFFQLFWLDRTEDVDCWNIPKAVKKCLMTLVLCMEWITSSYHTQLLGASRVSVHLKHGIEIQECEFSQISERQNCRQYSLPRFWYIVSMQN